MQSSSTMSPSPFTGRSLHVASNSEVAGAASWNSEVAAHVEQCGACRRPNPGHSTPLGLTSRGRSGCEAGGQLKLHFVHAFCGQPPG